MTSDEDLVHIVDAEDDSEPATSPAPWRLLVVDDDNEVHAATAFVLKGVRILGRPLLLTHASSAREARELLATDRDFAVLLLDVVMETDNAGLILIDDIRTRLRMTECRIILRTGQPGSAPEQNIFERYEINDYQIKAELNRTRLISAITAALRAYEQIHELAEHRRELARARNALAEILDNIPVPTFVLDANHRVSHWNRACAAITGIPADQVRGTDRQWSPFYPDARPVLADLVMRNDPAGIDTYYAGKARPSPVIPDAIEVEDYLPSLQRWLFFTAAVMHGADGEVIGAIETLQDVTAHKHAEMGLVEAKAVAESAARAKSEFLANMSHEIRTPLNAVIGLAHLVLKSELQPKQRDLVVRLKSAGEMLQQLINDILDFSKIESNRLSIERSPFVLDELLDNLSTIVAERAREKGLELHFVVGNDVPRHLVGDTLRLKQVLVNLVGNAIKFTERGQVLVFVWLNENGSDGVRLDFAVQDTGIGISHAQQAKLFRAFSQADASTTRKYGGTGLGLTICKRLVDLMGGRISVSSEEGEGTTFLFDVLLAAGNNPAAEMPASARERVLIVDDNEIARNVLSRLLRKLGYRVEVSDCGEAGLAQFEAAAADPFGLLFVDWHMPGIDGVEVVRRIQAKAGARPRIVVITASARWEAEAAFVEHGVGDVLQKPFSPSELTALLDNLHLNTGDGQSETDAPARLQGLRVLVVDDIAINRMIVGELLADEGASIDEAENGREAVDKVCGGGAYDVVLMDVQMPVLNGLDATREIHANPTHASLPIIAMTAFALDEERRHCIAAGMNGFLTKPIDPEAVIRTLDAYRPTTSQAAETTGSPTAVATVAGFPPLPGLDTVDGLRRMMNKPAFYEKMLKSFYERYANAPATVRTHLAAARIDDARREAHSAKGVAASLGAGPLAGAALSLELALAEGKTGVDAELAAFESALAEVVRGLCAHFGWSSP